MTDFTYRTYGLNPEFGNASIAFICLPFGLCLVASIFSSCLSGGCSFYPLMVWSGFAEIAEYAYNDPEKGKGMFFQGLLDLVFKDIANSIIVMTFLIKTGKEVTFAEFWSLFSTLIVIYDEIPASPAEKDHGLPKGYECIAYCVRYFIAVYLLALFIFNCWVHGHNQPCPVKVCGDI